MTEQQESFEKANTARHRAWLNETGMHECTLYRLDKDGSYQNPSTHSAWQGFQDGWQAALKGE